MSLKSKIQEIINQFPIDEERAGYKKRKESKQAAQAQIEQKRLGGLNK